jgi:hypothetical protein
VGQRLADIGVAGRGLIGETGFEVGTDRGHEVHGIGAAEAAVHALALLQAGVGDLHRAPHRLGATGRE